MKKVCIYALSILTAIGLSSCAGGGTTTPKTEQTNSQEYYTQTNLSALEYQMYLANKISVATGQLNTHMNKIKNVANGSCSYEDEIEILNSSIIILKEDKVDLTYVYPPDEYSSTRENSLTYWQNAIDKMQEISDLLSEESISQETAIQLSSELSDIYTSIQSLNFTV